MKAQGLPQLEAVFITVDPDRDTPEIMKNYLKGAYVVTCACCCGPFQNGLCFAQGIARN